MTSLLLLNVCLPDAVESVFGSEMIPVPLPILPDTSSLLTLVGGASLASSLSLLLSSCRPTAASSRAGDLLAFVTTMLSAATALASGDESATAVASTAHGFDAVLMVQSDLHSLGLTREHFSLNST